MPTPARRTLVRVLCLSAVACLACFALWSARGRAATNIVVNSTNDPGDGVCDATECTLREAITAANATANNDVINFDASLGGQTITLSGTQLTIANNGTLTINGLGANLLTVSGNNASRVFYINSGATATVSGLTVTQARFTTDNGGGFVADSSSTLTLTSLRITGNYAPSGGGIVASTGSTVNLSDSTVSNNDTLRSGGSLGGGIYNSQGTVNISNSTFSGNNAGFGGGIYNNGSMTVTDSTVSGNTADFGGGVSNGANFFVGSSTLTLTSTTISNNSASNGGGGFINFNSNTATLNNSIIANSTSGGDCDRSGGTVNAGYSLIETSLTCVNGTNSNNLTGDPNLGPLAFNGGPTQTHALQLGSPAIDKGDDGSAQPTTDQRGSPRPVDNPSVTDASDGTDIGAFEAAATPAGSTLTVNSTADTNDGACTTAPNGCTLREAITAADSLAGPDTINFDIPGAGPHTIQLGSALPDISASVDILNTSGESITVRGEGTADRYRIFTINAGQTVNISNLTVSNGATLGGVSGGVGGSGGNGGGIHNAGTLTLTNSTVSGNQTGSTFDVSQGAAGGNGGGILNSGETASAKLRNTIVALNSRAAGGSGPDLFGGFTSEGFNIIGTTAGATYTPSTGDQTPVSAAQLQLGPLASNGGPTQTRALLAGSVAIDRGENFDLTTDQRGLPRPQDDPATANPSPQPGDLSDIGAYEVQPPPNTAPVASPTPTPATTNEDTSVQITLTGTDADDNNLTFSITQQPTSGTLGTISPPNCTAVNTCTATVTYTPNLNFNGADSFKFKVNDGTTDSAEVTVQINVTAVEETGFVVTKTADTNDGACNSDCSLREAITEANNDPGAETISFNVTGAGCDATSGVCTIAPTSQLPTITSAMTIDGYTQPGATVNTLAVGSDAALKIELSGASAPLSTNGLIITAGGTTVRGLAINRFGGGGGVSIQLTGAGATGNIITGNYLGTNAAGTAAATNGNGIIITGGATNNRVGTNGDGAGDEAERNLVSGNSFAGISIRDAGTSGNAVAGNYVGTNASGAAALANTVGISIASGAANNRIGGTTAGLGNLIAFNANDGVQSPNTGTGNAVLSNSIFSNGTTSGDLGIDLNNEGVTPNDAGDPDTGPNNLQNFPLLATASSTLVTGTLNSTPSSTFRVEFFSNAACDTSGNGEGRTFLGSQNVTTDASGNAAINATLTVAATGGESVTATATDVTPYDHDNNAGTPDIPRNDTSEFSACRAVDATPPTVQSIVRASGSANPVTPGSLVQFTVTFSEDVTGVDSTDFVLTTTGDITGASVTGVTGSGTTYTVTVSTGSGTGAVRLDVNDDDTIKDAVQNPLGGAGADNGDFTGGETFTVQRSLSINDAARAEGDSGTTTFTFNVTLDSPAPAGGVSFTYSTADETAEAGTDYAAVANQAGSVAAGEDSTQITVTVNGDTEEESNETFFVNVTIVSGATPADAQGRGTILNDDGAPEAGQIMISEFRLRGPRPSDSPVPPAPGNEQGQLDEFIELYNNTDSDFVVADVSPLGLATDGWAIYSSDDLTKPKYVVPAGTRIPARGHFLVTNSGGYSLSSYAAADTVADPSASPVPASYSADIPDGAGLALFRTGSPVVTSTDDVLDRVGFAPEAPVEFAPSLGALPVVFSEGTPLDPPGGVSTPGQYSFLRKLSSGRPRDTDNNREDFAFVSTDGGTYDGAQSALGAPGPQNTESPLLRNFNIKSSLIDTQQPYSAPPNSVRKFCPPAGTTAPDTAAEECDENRSKDGTYSIRRRWKNGTGAAVTRLRFRIVNVTTLNSPGYSPGTGQADVRALTSQDVTDVEVTGGNDKITVYGTTLEEPPAQNLGGGLNATLATGLTHLGGTLAPGHTVDLQFLLGVQRAGSYAFFVNVEAVTEPSPPGAGPSKSAPARAKAGKAKPGR